MSAAALLMLITSASFASAGQPSPWTCPAGVWAFTGGAPNHPSLTHRPFPNITAPRWALSTDQDGNSIRWVWQSTPVATPDLVLAVGFVSAPNQSPNRPFVFAVSRDTGLIEWATAISPISIQQFFQSSQSSLCIDVRNDAVVSVLGTKVTALRLSDGEQMWQTTLPRNIINATPVVTDDQGPRDRLYITDFDAASGGGSLYCINVDKHCPVTNPWDRGEVVWTAPIFGASGNTPAYLPRRKGGCDRLVVSSAGHFGQAPGRVYAFPAGTDVAPAPLWTTINVLPSGFFGGLNLVARGPSGGMEVLATSYEFYGGLFSANLLRMDAANGTVLGTALVNRSSAIPVLIANRLIATTGGIESSFNLGDTVPTLSLYDMDLLDPPATPTVGSQVWNSALSTWVDLDFDGVIDPGEYFNVGGYTHQPVVSTWRGRNTMAVGSFATGDNPAASNLLAVVDLDLDPSSPSFVQQFVAGAGGSPAVAGPNLYSIGLSGLTAYGPEPERFDVDSDKLINAGDLAKWERGQGSRDINDDGSVTTGDREALVTLLRAGEVSDMLEGRK